MDERGKHIGARAMGLTLALTYFYLLFVTIWKYVSTKDILNSAPEIGLLVLIPFSILWFSRKDESVMLPKTFIGNELPISTHEQASSKRVKHYILNSAGLSISFMVLTITALLFIEKDASDFILFPNHSDIVNYTIAISMELVLGFIVFFAISYVWGEYIIKKYRMKLEELEDDDE